MMTKHNNSSLLERQPITLPSDQEASGRTLGKEEIELVTQALTSGTLTSTKGSFVKELETQFAERFGVRYAFACASGTAAIHCAIAALDLEPGDEVITTAITDMGALTPVLYQLAIPVFADVDPQTYNITADTIRARLSDKTRAIIVTHLFGYPSGMREIMALAEQYRIPVIEDCAQAFLARYDDRLLGTFGDLGCFSLQQGKHITTGEGGIVVTDNADLARRVRLFINKAWGYGDPKPDHYFLALNYRMCELQGAVAVAQLQKLDAVVKRRIDGAEALSARLQGLSGIELPWFPPSVCVCGNDKAAKEESAGCGASNGTHVFWKYCLNVDEQLISGGAVGLGQYLQQRGIACAPRYIQKPAFECEVIREQRTFGTSRIPFNLARPEAVDYAKEHYCGTYKALQRILVLPWNENYTDEHIDFIAETIRQGIAELAQP